jgi:hypothetical protein
LGLEGSTWSWKVRCHNGKGIYQPEGRYVNLRKKQRLNEEKILAKLLVLCEMWNCGQWEYKPYEKLKIPLENLRKKISELKRESRNEMETGKEKNNRA